MTTVAASRPPPAQWGVAGVGFATLLAGALLLGADGWRLGALFGVGGLLGVTLYHAAFGFTSAYRNALVRGDDSGVGAQVVMRKPIGLRDLAEKIRALLVPSET